MRFLAAFVSIAGLVLIVGACFFDSGSGGSGVRTGVVARLGSIPTATPPAQLPEPVLLGQTQAGSRPAGPGGGGDTYVTKSGDTIAGIAASLGVLPDQQAAWVAEVLRLNGILDARLIGVGIELRLPRTPTQTARATATATPSPATAAPATRTPPPATTSTPRPAVQAGPGTYTVVSGDFPLLIAEKLGVPPSQALIWAAELVRINNLTPNAIAIGTLLQLPAGTPQQGAPATPTRVP